MALDITRPLLETNDGNMYDLVTIDHYSKWCEASLTRDHDVATAARFFKKGNHIQIWCA